MKKNILEIFTLTMVLLFSVVSEMDAQNFLSRPTAIRNLADGAKELIATLPALEEGNTAMYKVNQEKIRFIKNMLQELKKGTSLEDSVDKILPKKEWNKLQPSVRFIDTSFANLTRNEYIRQEVLFLITY